MKRDLGAWLRAKVCSQILPQAQLQYIVGVIGIVHYVFIIIHCYFVNES